MPLQEISNQPEHQVRYATLPVPGEHSVWIWYVHVYATDQVDITAVTNRWPATSPAAPGASPRRRRG